MHPDMAKNAASARIHEPAPPLFIESYLSNMKLSSYKLLLSRAAQLTIRHRARTNGPGSNPFVIPLLTHAVRKCKKFPFPRFILNCAAMCPIASIP